jgi:hypothetical protein
MAVPNHMPDLDDSDKAIVAICETIAVDRYPMSLRIQRLKAILAKPDPPAPPAMIPAPKPPGEPSMAFRKREGANVGQRTPTGRLAAQGKPA